VSPGRLELCVRGQTTSCETDEIGRVSIDQGCSRPLHRREGRVVYVEGRGSTTRRWPTQLFLFVLDKLANVRIR
jgi:hypothetical protein